MKGPQTKAQPAVFGTKGVEDTANIPSGRLVYARWKDNTGKLWLFDGRDNGGAVFYNDLWRYNIATNSWTWIAGDSSGNAQGFYGTKCVASPFNIPGQRFENRVAWTDANGNFWMFGGGISNLSNAYAFVWNDLWMYSVAANQWMWAAGDTVSNRPGNWGVLGVPNITNKPTGRVGAVGWTDHNGHLYLFGGSGAWPSPHNDLWKYTIDSSCGGAVVAPPVALFQSSDTTICTFDCISFIDQSTNATMWQWSFPGASPSSSTMQNPQNICYSTAGAFKVTLIATNSAGSDTVTFNNYISVNASPPTPNITQSHDTLFCSTDPTYTSYQWYMDTTLIQGATDTLYAFSQTGQYNVKVSNEKGCSIAVGITVVGIKEFFGDNSIFLYPNPVGNEIIIRSKELRIENIGIYNVLGQCVYAVQPQTINSKPETAIDVSALSAGIYFVKITNKGNRLTGRFVKE